MTSFSINCVLSLQQSKFFNSTEGKRKEHKREIRMQLIMRRAHMVLNSEDLIFVMDACFRPSPAVDGDLTRKLIARIRPAPSSV